MSKTIKIIAFYVGGILCLVLYHQMANSTELKELLEKSGKIHNSLSFGFYTT